MSAPDGPTLPPPQLYYSPDALFPALLTLEKDLWLKLVLMQADESGILGQELASHSLHPGMGASVERTTGCVWAAKHGDLIRDVKKFYPSKQASKQAVELRKEVE